MTRLPVQDSLASAQFSLQRARLPIADSDRLPIANTVKGLVANTICRTKAKFLGRLRAADAAPSLHLLVDSKT